MLDLPASHHRGHLVITLRAWAVGSASHKILWCCRDIVGRLATNRVYK